MHRLSEAERNGGFLSDQGVSAKTETDINDFRNQLKASSSFDPSPFLLSNPSNFTSYCIILGTPLPSHWWLTREASGLAVSYVDQSDGDTRLVVQDLICIRCWCKSSFCKGKLALLDSIESVQDSRAKSYNLKYQHLTQFARFSLQQKYLHQDLMHLILSMQVFLPFTLSASAQRCPI